MYSKINAAQIFRKFASDKQKEYVKELKAQLKIQKLSNTKEVQKIFCKYFDQYRSELNQLKDQLINTYPEFEEKIKKISAAYFRKFRIEQG